MKSWIFSLFLFAALPLTAPDPAHDAAILPAFKPAANLFIITIDGFRWQEIFTGADEQLINNPDYTADTATMKMLYWANTEEERRKKLMPFLWNVLAAKGQLHGNRKFDNNVNVCNLYSISYPGYNELFTGHTDISVASNKKKKNSHVNVLEYLNNKETFKGKVVAFTSWDVFPYILNEERSGLPVNSGYEAIGNASLSEEAALINKVQDEGVLQKGNTRFDQLTFITAKEYLRAHQPKVVYIGWGEADEFAHEARYDLYLEQANKTDRMIAELWHWIQSTPGYKENTTLLITTDHGRGSKDSRWMEHNTLVKGSSQTWLALLGPGIQPLGEIKEANQLYQQEIAGIIAGLVGEEFGNSIVRGWK